MSESGTAATPDGVSSTGTIPSPGAPAPGHPVAGAASTLPTSGSRVPAGTGRALAGQNHASAGESRVPAGTLLLAVLATLWLAATLWSTRPAFGAVPDGGRLGLLAATLELPGLLAAVLAAGTGAGLLARTLTARRYRRPVRRGGSAYPVTAAAGLGAGLISALVVGLAGAGTPVIVLVTAITAAGAAGGLAAGIRSRTVITAGLAGALAGFGTDFLMKLVQNAAGSRLAGLGASVGWISALLIGLVAAAVAYPCLRRLDSAARWQHFMLAGATYGLLELLATLGARAVAGQAFGLGAVVTMGAVNYALVVMFAGALGATLLHGRSLPPRPEPGN